MAELMEKLLLAVFLLISATNVAESFSHREPMAPLRKLIQVSSDVGQDEIQKCAIDAIDLVICLDASSSIVNSDFGLEKEFIANLTTFLNIGAGNTQSRVGLVLFTLAGSISFYLKTYSTNSDVYSAIIGALRPDTSDGTNIAACMNTAIDIEFATSNGARPGVPRIFILLTDGQDASDVAGAHTSAVRNGIVTYAVGVGPDVNNNQLVAATGDPSKVFHAPNFNALQNILSDLCGQIASSVNPTTYTTPFTSGSASGGTNSARTCSTSSPSKIALDIIFALDSSQAVGADNYDAFKVHMANVIKLLTVNQGGATRIGLIYYADKAYTTGQLTSYNSALDAANNIKAMPYLDVIKLDMRTALNAAQGMFQQQGSAKRKQVLVLASTGCTECKDNGKANANGTCGTGGPDQEEACRVAASLKQSGVIIMTILLKLDSDTTLPPISLATPCYAFANNAALTRNLVYGWYTVSCYCGDDHYTQVSNPADKCQKYAECVLLQLTPDTWENAQATCQGEGAGTFLADEFSDQKQAFLKSIAIAGVPSGNPFYWIGLNDRAQPGTYMWDRGTGNAVPAQSGDYTYWGPGRPNDANGNCIAQSNKVGFQLFWENRQCNDPLTPSNNLYFFCQQNACDIDNQCG